MLTKLIGFAAAEWFGVAWDYIVAGVMVAAGVYLAFVLDTSAKLSNPLLAKLLTPLLGIAKYVGYVLIVIGIFRGAIAYGKSVGAADCEAAWKAQNFQAQIDKLKLENSTLKIANAAADSLQAGLALSTLTDTRKLADGEAATRNSPTCRRSTTDDDSRMRALTGQ